MTTSTTCSRWYVIKCKFREEYRALEHLQRQGYTCYLPELEIERINHQRKHTTKEPLFPNYLFIQLNNIDDNWYPIRSTRGVNHLVRFNNQALPVDDQLIVTIRQRLTANPLKVPYLKSGERVRIVEGPFAQLEAIFLANNGEQRVLLLLDILHSEQRLTFPVTAIRKVAN